MRVWTAAEEDLLRELYAVDKARLCRELNRSPKCIRGKAERMGLALSVKFWKTSEVSRLRELYPRSNWETLLRAFPGRSKGAIHRMAMRLKIRRNERPELELIAALERRVAALESFLVL